MNMYFYRASEDDKPHTADCKYQEFAMSGRDNLADLTRLNMSGFDGDTRGIASALGRDEQQIIDMLLGITPIDVEAAIKVTEIASKLSIDLD